MGLVSQYLKLEIVPESCNDSGTSYSESEDVNVHTNSLDFRNKYFKELTTCLRQAGFSMPPQEDDLLSVEWNGKPLCRITGSGSIRYRQEDMVNPSAELACERATDIAAMTLEYTSLMDKAPNLKVDGLGENYKLLADFNGAVLAGHPTEYGVQFITWEWSYGRTGLWQGHYYNNDYKAAKQDFSVRAGLIRKNQLFSDEQLAEIYRCIHEILEGAYPIAFERQRLLVDTAEQIEYTVPQLNELVNQSHIKEMEVTDGATYQSMTQQI